MIRIPLVISVGLGYEYMDGCVEYARGSRIYRF